MSASKILIVDDELSIRIMLTRMIEPLKHEVYCAEDGVAALELVHEMEIDLIISDLMMPRMDGLRLLEQVRSEGSDCACIILTGYGDLPQALAARDRFNISNFLVKPIHNMDQFLFDVESALSRRMLQRENQRLMASLQGINAQLEEKVRERTHELEMKNRELARLSRFRADALKVLGHELRTPLAILSGYHALANGSDSGDMSTLAPAMGGAIDRLQEIVEKALRLLQAEELTEFPLELREVAAVDLCERVAERIGPFLSGRGLEIALPPGCAYGRTCQWDPEKMEEVIEELLINAVRASPDGSRIEVLLEGETDALTLSIRDHGVGVAPEDCERIFEPFVTLTRADHHRSGLFDFGAEGIGIGLSTARMWVTLHGGTISAHPSDGTPGTTVRVRVPRNAAARASLRDEDGTSPADEPQRFRA